VIAFVTGRVAALAPDGAVVEVGTHDELIASDGLYAELFGLQAAAYTARPD